LAENAAVMSWRGEKGGIQAATTGHDAVMSPSNRIYLDHGQSESPLEPAHWPGTNSLAHVYGYEPVPAALSPVEARHILGLQGNLWTVFVHEEWLLDLQTWPRAAAIAEVGWSAKEGRSWDDFHRRMKAHRPRLDALGVNYWWEESREFGRWTPAALKPGQEAVNMDFDITASAAGLRPGKQSITVTYTKGAHGLSLQSATLLENGREISSDKHEGFAGSKHTGNTYALEFPTFRPDARYVLRIRAFGDGGTDSYGLIGQSAVETKRLK
jgi:N-acetyl-beta-hexosaminidase